MSARTNDTSTSTGDNSDGSGDDAAPDQPPHRYTATLAREIELQWQAWWDEHDTFHTPNPVGPLGDAELAEQPR